MTGTGDYYYWLAKGQETIFGYNGRDFSKSAGVSIYLANHFFTVSNWTRLVLNCLSFVFSWTIIYFSFSLISLALYLLS